MKSKTIKYTSYQAKQMKTLNIITKIKESSTVIMFSHNVSRKKKLHIFVIKMFEIAFGFILSLSLIELYASILSPPNSNNSKILIIQ